MSQFITDTILGKERTQKHVFDWLFENSSPVVTLKIQIAKN